MDIQAILLTILLGAVAGVSYALIFYAKAVQSGAEPFDLKKFTRALLIGLIVGGISAASGIPLTEATYQTQVLAYGFVTVLVDQIIKLLWRARNPPP